MIREGTADVDVGGEIKNKLGPDDFFGEIGVLENELRSATVVATSSMRLITLTHWELKRMRNMPGVMEKIEDAINARRAPSGGAA